jgi:hypothetical protein
MKFTAYKLYLDRFKNEEEAECFSKIATLLKQQPNLRTTKYRNENLDSEDILQKLSTAFNKGRQLKPPSISKSPVDTAISMVAESWFAVPKSNIKKFFEYHKQAMSVENIIGTYLEAYINSVLCTEGWIWCSGSIVNKVDFVKTEKNNFTKYLQVKCRDNTENSSSQTVRDGTRIEKWFRLYNKNGKTNWGAFPDNKGKILLTEIGFLNFLKEKFER